MTTPAINILTWDYVGAYSRTYYPDGEIVTTGPSTRMKGAFYHYRPESINSPQHPVLKYRLPTGWVHDKVVWRFPLYTTRVPGAGGSYTISDNSYSFSTGSPLIGPFTSGMEGRAINGALEKLKNQHVNLCLAFAERKKTIGLFNDLAAEVKASNDRFKQKHRSVWNGMRNALPGVRALPRIWLAYQYGFKPLVSDVTGSLIKLNEMEQLPRPYWFTVKKTIRQQDTVEDRSLMFYNGNPSYPVVASRFTDEICHVSLTYSMRFDPLASLASLGIINPFSLAYELLPYSFVLDWALPVGNYLNLLDADAGWDFQYGSVGRLKKVEIDGMYAELPPDVQILGGNASEMRHRLDSFSRYTLTSSPWPVFPEFENPLSKTHVANAIALLVSSYR